MASVGHRVSLGVNHGVGHGVIPEDVCGHHLKICLSPHNCYKFYKTENPSKDALDKADNYAKCKLCQL